MTRTTQRRFLVWFAATMVGGLYWLLVPGTRIDRSAFDFVVRGFANPPFFISGDGSRDTPWRLRTFGSSENLDKRQAPLIVSMGDDIEGYFQSSPPSPIDLAVILTNFQRLGAKKAATASVLSWDDPDPIGLVALEKAIGRFDSLVMAAPLSRGANPEPIPPAFRNASVPLASVHGDTSSFPIVNRIPLTGVILGGEKSMAGFQTLESEKPTRFAPLLARWEDRVVVAFPLLTVMQRLNLKVDGMEIHPGKFIKLGPDGPTVPIDTFGRLSIPLTPVSPYATISAAALIDGGDDLFPKLAPEPVVLRDDRSSAEPSTRAFSKMLPATIAAIASDAGLAGEQDFQRVQERWELSALGILAIVLTVFCALPEFSRNIVFLGIGTICLASQLVAAGIWDLWLPGIPALAAVLSAFSVSSFIKETLTKSIPPEATPMPMPETIPDPEPAPMPIQTPEPAAEPTPEDPPAKKAGRRSRKRGR